MMTRRAALGAIALLAGPLAARAAAQGGEFDYLIQAQEMEVSLYERARDLDLTGEAAALAGRYANHEAEHLQRLREALRREGEIQVSLVDFSEEDFTGLAQRVEGLVVGAINGAIPAVRDRGVRAELAAIVQTDARHAAAIRELRGNTTAPRNFDPGVSREGVDAALAALQAS
jgi:Ferritin-like domain